MKLNKNILIGVIVILLVIIGGLLWQKSREPKTLAEKARAAIEQAKEDASEAAEKATEAASDALEEAKEDLEDEGR